MSQRPDLFAFGSRQQPRPPRIQGYNVEEGRDPDLIVNENGLIPSNPEQGASTFADVEQTTLTGHFHRLRGDVQLPDGLAVIEDGRDINEKSPHPPTHHTIYATKSMSPEEFTNLFLSLPWEYGGKK